MANGVYQNTVYGMAAKLPPKYTGAVILGNNICGTFTTLVCIASEYVSTSKRMAAIWYFITALFVLLIGFDTYFALPLNVSIQQVLICINFKQAGQVATLNINCLLASCSLCTCLESRTHRVEKSLMDFSFF